MTMKLFGLLTVGFTLFLSGETFYQQVDLKNVQVVTPKTLEELKKALCDKYNGGDCADDTNRKIIINKVFDFTGSEGTFTEVGCHHKAKPKQCFKTGQLKLNVNNQCLGMPAANVTYSKAGRRGLTVGSNKIIMGQNGGGLKGKGLRLHKSQNVEVRNLRITDINGHVVWGGDAIELSTVKNVLIDGCYIKNIGRMMIVTHYSGVTGVTISNNVFDGNTKHSATCNGAHYWLFLFLGTGDQITMQNNVILNTSGRGPKLVANNNSKSLLHMIQNIYYNTKGYALDLGDAKSSVLMEGNVFVNVKKIVHKNLGNIFMPQSTVDQNKCEAYLGRKCILNKVVKSGGNKVSNSQTVLEDFKAVRKYLTKPIDMKKFTTNLIQIPAEVKPYIN